MSRRAYAILVYMASFHRQVTIGHRGRTAKVDEGIAPLIVALWRRGFRTLSSCERQQFGAVIRHVKRAGRSMAIIEPGTSLAWVGFASLSDAKKARRIIGGRLLVPKPEHFAQASAASFKAGYSAPGLVAVTIPCDGIREAADRVLRSLARRRKRPAPD